MTIFSIFARNAEVEAVPDRFSWFAALLPPIYALVHGLWWALGGYVVAVAALVGLSQLIGDDAAGMPCGRSSSCCCGDRSARTVRAGPAAQGRGLSGPVSSPGD